MVARRNRAAIGTKDGVTHLLLVKSLARFTSEQRKQRTDSTVRDAALGCEHVGATAAGDGEVVVLQINENGRLAVADGYPTFRGVPRSLEDAAARYGPFDGFQEFPAAFGCIQLDRLFLLVATEVQLAAELPFDRKIFTISASKWVTMPVRGIPPPRLSLKDEGRIKAFLETTFASGYYFSDDADVETPFPCLPARRQLVGEYFECDFSSHLRRPFRDIPTVDPETLLSTLIRGFAASFTIPSTQPDRSPLNVVLLGRQNNANPGPRYHSRGLNGKRGVGNDHIYELVLWRYAGPGARDEATFTRHTILRGTIPLNWRSEIRSSIGDAEVILGSSAEVLSGSAEYFADVVGKLRRLAAHDTNTSSDSSRAVSADALSPSTPNECAAEVSAAGPVSGGRALDGELQDGATANEERQDVRLRCINLLRHRGCPGEEQLSKYFVDAVRLAETQLEGEGEEGASTTLDLVHLDWLNTVKDESLDAAVEELWQLGVLFLTARGLPTASAGRVTAAGTVEWTATQRDFVRVNCADSLDRTNVGCFFTCVEVALDMCAMMGVDPTTELRDGSSGSAATGPSSPAGAASPRGGGSTSDAVPASTSELLFDVNAVADTRKREALREPFVQRLDHLTQPERYPRALLRAIAHMFVLNGDCVAMLYTNSGALHTHVIRNYVPGMKGASANALLSVQRRFENIFEDKRKFRGLETLLGRNLPSHFPTLFRTNVFGVCPIPQHLWGATLVVRGVPAGTRTAEIQRSLKNLWDEVIAARLERDVESGAGTVVVHSSALGIRVFEAFTSLADDPLSPALLFDRSLDAAIARSGAEESPQLPIEPQQHVDCASTAAARHIGEASPAPTPTFASAAAQQASTSSNPYSVNFDDYDDLADTDVRLVVVQFDSDTCKIVDVAGEFLKLGSVPFEVSQPDGATEMVALPIERYCYDVRRAEDTSGMRPGKIAKTLRSGIRDTIKSIVRRF